ncbi:MAG: sialate O-acetylesterase [Akkermansiaceae bacterium]
MKSLTPYLPHLKNLVGIVAFISLSPVTSHAATEKENSGKKPLKVFIMAGQSNMQGRARITTLPHMRLDPKTAPMAAKIADTEDNPTPIKDVWIASLGVKKNQEEKKGQLIAGYGYDGGGGTKIGPEMGFAITMQEHLNEPILIIKTTWGGKSLFENFRPPSAGPWDFGPGAAEKSSDPKKTREERRKNSGEYYHKMTEYIRNVLGDIKSTYPDYNPEQGYEIAGFVWFQGVHDYGDSATYPNQGTPSSYDEYSRLLSCLIRDLRKDLQSPKMPFVIGVLGISGDLRHMEEKLVPWTKEFRKSMAAPASLPEFKDNVAAVLTEKYWEYDLEEYQLRWSKIKAKENELKQQQIAHLENKPSTRRLKLEPEYQAKLEAFKRTVYTEEELNLFLTGTSNAAYHYLGSYKIYSRIGKAFAEALVELSEVRGAE